MPLITKPNIKTSIKIVVQAIRQTIINPYSNTSKHPNTYPFGIVCTVQISIRQLQTKTKETSPSNYLVLKFNQKGKKQQLVARKKKRLSQVCQSESGI